MGKQRSTKLSTGDGHRERDGVLPGVPSHPECHPQQLEGGQLGPAANSCACGQARAFFFSFFNNYFMIFAKIYLSIMLFGLFLLNNCDYLMIIWYQAICRLKRLKLLRLVQVKLLQRRVVVVVVAAMGPARDQALCQSLCPALARRGGYAAARARGGSRCPVRSTNSPSCPAAESAPARSSPLTLCDTVQRAHKHST